MQVHEKVNKGSLIIASIEEEEERGREEEGCVLSIWTLNWAEKQITEGPFRQKDNSILCFGNYKLHLAGQTFVKVVNTCMANIRCKLPHYRLEVAKIKWRKCI